MADSATGLLLMNTDLPRADGLDFLRRLRMTNDVPVILMSDGLADTEEAYGLHLGADDFLGKPLSPRVMLERVRAVLRHAQPNRSRPDMTSRMMRGP
jgi:two-component system response regulator ChvI